VYRHLRAYSELATTPEPLHDSQLVECQHAKQDLGRVREAKLPRQEAPQLPIAPDVWHHSDVQIVPRVGDGCEQGADDSREDEELRNRRVGEAGGYHRMGGEGGITRSSCSVRVRVRSIVETHAESRSVSGGATANVAESHVHTTKERDTIIRSLH
jgi:hypothetical protein